VTGPLGTNDVATATYDAYGRTRTRTDVSGYTLIFDYDALDRITRITHPDSTFEQITYNRLQPSVIQDRAGRQTLLQYDALGQLIQRTDPLGRVTRFQWCSCGDIKSLTDPMGRTTTWHKDLQDRLIAKQFGDRSQITYTYENTTSRLREVQDEKLQFTSYDYNLDNTVRAIGYANTATLTPGVNFTYDPDYPRLTSMTDGTGTTLYQYVPITTTPALGAGKLTSETDPLPISTITYSYDELGRRVSTAINGVASTLTFDAAGRVTGETNALGSFSYVYDGASGRIILEAFPNGQTTSRAYFDKVGDFTLQRITYAAGAIPVSQFQYEHDLPANRITTWSQQAAALAPDVYTFGYDNANQLLSALVTNSGARVTAFAYSYDPAGNRLTEQVGGAVNAAAYNALNQEASVTGAGASQTNEWDASDRLVAVNSPSQRTEFAYDGINRLASIRLLTNGVQASMRRFVWSGDRVGEERDAAGTRTKQYFEQGMRLESGANAGNYYYTRDHLRSIRELTDSGGNVRARYAYDPYGRPTRLAGDLQADFGFAGMLWSAEAGLALTRFRAYDANVGRWLSRDPLGNAEVEEGPNLYLYVANNPINRTDPLGLFGDTGHIPTPPSAPDCCAAEEAAVDKLLHEIYTTGRCGRAQRQADAACQDAYANRNPNAYWICSQARLHASDVCEGIIGDNAALQNALEALERCRAKPCKKSCSPPPAPQPHFDPYGYGHVWFE
jgi:RHS repeat-associated protein